MTRNERLIALAVFCRDFNRLLDDVPADRQDEVRELFCDAMGQYLRITEGKEE